MRVVFSEAAEADLEDIGDYIAKDSARRAVTYVQELRECTQSLTVFPERFQLVPRYEHRGIRRRPYGAYLIFYTCMDSQVGIVRILRGDQDYEAILFP